ncbi:MAG: hypothetical protein EHM72_05490 [Calditrichaeota bacterium]|nr:MAG: hypothetical protein EHM72_05490 [Calditrichota bacterium]
MKTVRQVANIAVIVSQVEAKSVDELRQYGDLLREKMGSGIAVLAASVQGKGSLVCMVTKDLIDERGLRAGDIVKQVAGYAGGSGGGSPHMALAGIKEVGKLAVALSHVDQIILQLSSSATLT